MKNKLNFIKIISFFLTALLAFMILITTYYVAKNIAISAELKSAKNLVSSVNKYLEYKLNLIEVQADSFASNPQVVKLVTQYDSLDDYEKYAIDNAIQQYLNAISDTARVISFILYIPRHPNITPQLRGQSPYNVNDIGQNRNLISQLKEEGWGILPSNLEIKFGADKDTVNQSICYFKWIGDKNKKEGIVVFGVNYELLNELLDEAYGSSTDEFMLVSDEKVVYSKTRISLNTVKHIGLDEFIVKDKKLIYHYRAANFPLDIYVAKQVGLKGLTYIPFIIFLFVTLLAWIILSMIMKNIKKELTAIETYMNTLQPTNEIKLLNEFYNSAQELIETKEEISRMNVDITKKFSVYLENELKSVNIMIEEIRGIEDNMGSIEGIWYKMRELFLSISDNINKIMITEDKFSKRFIEDNQKIQEEAQKLGDIIGDYKHKIEDIVNKKRVVSTKIDRISSQLERIKELENFNRQNINSVEQLDIISLNSIIKTTKEESNRTLNMISQQLIYQTKLLKSDLVNITKIIQNIIESTPSISKYNNVMNNINSYTNYDIYFDEIKRILCEMSENVIEVNDKTKQQKDLLRSMIDNYNIAFDEVTNMKDYFYELTNSLRAYRISVDGLKNQLEEIMEIITKLKKHWSE
jgi:methyl-accepting chemotaxis protein